MDSDISLRVADLADEAFLFLVYASNHGRDREPEAWAGGQGQTSLRTDFNTEQRYYRLQYPQAETYIIQKRRRPIGRLIIDRSQYAIYLLDLTLLPEHRNSGLGTGLISEVIDEADRTFRPVKLHVEAACRATNLYRRLGFSPAGERGHYLEMTRQPNVDAAV